MSNEDKIPDASTPDLVEQVDLKQIPYQVVILKTLRELRHQKHRNVVELSH